MRAALCTLLLAAAVLCAGCASRSPVADYKSLPPDGPAQGWDERLEFSPEPR